jgi:hypothetical protein
LFSLSRLFFVYILDVEFNRISESLKTFVCKVSLRKMERYLRDERCKMTNLYHGRKIFPEVLVAAA